MAFARGQTYAGVAILGIASLMLAAIWHMPATTFAAQPAHEDTKQAIASVLASAVQVSAGADHTCALTISGGVKCWGNNFMGQLGDGTAFKRNSPVDVYNLSSGVIKISTGPGHSCAVMVNRQVKCWGQDMEGELGDRSNVFARFIPVDVIDLDNVVDVSLSYGGTCALINTGSVKCWGRRSNFSDGTTSLIPQDVPELVESVVVISSGSSHTCALGENGGIKCWGSNYEGALGKGSVGPSYSPVNVLGLTSGVKAISAGGDNTCALTINGVVKCWGSNYYGQLGDNSNVDKYEPVNVYGITSGVIAISTGLGDTCALLFDKSMKCWGDNRYGQLGDGSYENKRIPIDVVVGNNIKTIGTGSHHICIQLVNDTINCWGDNQYGQLGNGTFVNSLTPVTVLGFEETMLTSTPTSTPTPTRMPSSGGDPYEPDDTCASASAIATDGTVQQHTFHQQGDKDWVSFSVSAGGQYVIEGDVPPGSPADLALEVYGQCGGVTLGSQNYPYGPGVRLDFTAPANGTIYLKLQNSSGSVFGPQVAYQLSVRALSAQPAIGAVIIVAGRYRDGDPLQANIHNVTNDVYAMFAHHGYDSSRIRYLATNLGMTGVNALPSRDNLRASITQWALDKVDAAHALTIYLMDHGGSEAFYLDREHGEVLTPSDLDSWLSELETARPGVKINIIVETCYSGSFITRPSSISKAGRVVIASTNASNYAWASNIGGAWFSDVFVTGLDRGQSLFDAFSSARWAVQNAFVLQTPWLDDNGDGQFSAADGDEAQKRGFAYAGTFGDDNWPPYVASVSVNVTGRTGERQIAAQALDDTAVQFVWAVIYPPSYQPPPTSDELVNENLQTVVLLKQADGLYGATYPGFTEPGTYRVVVFAQDNQGASAQPVSVRVANGGQVFLPMLTR